MARTIAIEVVVDDKGAVKGIRGIDGEVKNLERDSKSATKSGFNMGSAFSFAVGGLMVKAVDSFRRVTRRLVREGADLVGLSAEIFERQSKLGAVFKSSTPLVQDYIEQYAALSGLSKSTAEGLLATTGAILEGAGFAHEAAAQMSIDVAKLAGDLTSFHDVPIEQTFGALQSALTGERERLKQLGIVLNETEVQQRALMETGKESVSQLNQQEKAAASLALIYEKAGAAVGDLARTQDSASNQMRQIKGRLEELREELAIELLPPIQTVATELNEFLKDPALKESAKEVGQNIANGLEIAIATIRTVIKFLQTYQGEVQEGIRITAALTIAVIAYRAAVKGAAIATSILNTTISKGKFGVFLGVILAIVAGFVSWDAITRKINEAIGDNSSALDTNLGALDDWSEAALRARLIFLALQEDQLRGDLKMASLVGDSPERVKKLNDALLETRKLIGQTKIELTGREAPDSAPEPVAPTGSQKEASEDEIAWLEWELENKARIREEERTMAEIDAQADLDLQSQLIEQGKLLTDAEREEAAKRKAIHEQEAAARLATMTQLLQADSDQITSAKDAANAVVANVKRIIRARLAEAIAAGIAKQFRKGFAGLAAAAILGPLISVAFNKLIPKFASGTRNHPGGPSVLHERGGEIAVLPSGSKVIPAPQSARMMGGGSGDIVPADTRIDGEDIYIVWGRVKDRYDREGRS